MQVRNNRDVKESKITDHSDHELDTSQIRKTPDYIMERYHSCKHWRLFSKEFMFKHLKDVPQKEVLDFGCGTGEISTQMAKMGAYVTGIDVFPQLIETANKRASLDKVQDRVKFFACDVTKSTHIKFPLSENKFDYIVCHKVLHHVDISKTIQLLYSCLKPGGVAIMIEPTTFSPLLQKIREIVPVEKDADPDDHQVPLNKKDLDTIIGFFEKSDVEYFNLFGRLQRLLTKSKKIDKGHPILKTVVIILLGFDRLLLKFFPFLWRFYGTTIIVGQKALFSR